LTGKWNLEVWKGDNLLDERPTSLGKYESFWREFYQRKRADLEMVLGGVESGRFCIDSHCEFIGHCRGN